MNDWFRGLDTGAMRESFVDAFTAAPGERRFTYPSLFPLFRLDHIYVAGAVTVQSCSAVALKGSDHLPVVAKLELTAASVPRRATA